MMSNVFALAESMIRKEKKDVDKRVNALMTELSHEDPLLPETPFRLLQRVLKLHRGGKAILSLVVRLPLMPTTWSAVIDSLSRGLDALDTPEVMAMFKAGKDL